MELGHQLKIVVCTADSPDAFEQVLADEEQHGNGETTRDFFEDRVGAFLFRQIGGRDESRFVITRTDFVPGYGRRLVPKRFDELYPINRRMFPANASFFVQVIDASSSCPNLLACLAYETAEQVTESCVPDLQAKLSHIIDCTPVLSTPFLDSDSPSSAGQAHSSEHELRGRDVQDWIKAPKMRSKVAALLLCRKHFLCDSDPRRLQLIADVEQEPPAGVEAVSVMSRVLVLQLLCIKLHFFFHTLFQTTHKPMT